jgi:hypothetical protein
MAGAETMSLHEMREDSQKCEKQGSGYHESDLTCYNFSPFSPIPLSKG